MSNGEGINMTTTSGLARELGAIKVGDTFLRLTADYDGFWRGGEIGKVVPACQGFDGPCLRAVEWTAVLPTDEEIASGDWQRVPAGYVLPTAVEWHAQVVRLVAARDRMAADPATGTSGVMQCIAQMRAMAGMEAPT